MPLLVTTALEQTWGSDEPIIFLGEWCIPFSQQRSLSSRSYKVLSYHWSSREKLRADFAYLNGLYERILPDLASKLNEIHCVNYDIRYWRILVGPWLLYFTQIFFDRWYCIRQAILTNDISETIVLSVNPGSTTPNDMADFVGLMTTDLWNHAIYAYLIETYTTVTVRHVPFIPNQLDSSQGALFSNQITFKNLIRSLLNKISAFTSRDTDAFIVNSYLPMKAVLGLQLRLGQFPSFWSSPSNVGRTKYIHKRDWIISNDSDDEFECALRGIIPQQIPFAYAEGYRSLVFHSNRLGWPKKPKLIYTCNNHFHDDLFKSWAAARVYSGTPLVIGTHGSGPVGEFSAATRHELAISSYHMGPVVFDDFSHKSISDIHHFRPLVKRDPRGIGLLVELDTPRYSYALASVPVASEFLSYLEEQFRFYGALPPVIQQQFLVRPHPGADYWDVRERWHDRYPNVSLDSGNISFRASVSRSRLVVSSYFASNYSDLIGSNIPMVAFWSPLLFQAHGSAIDIFQDLKCVGILHDTPESAAAHIARIWEDIDTWWCSAEVRMVRERFCRRYANIPENLAAHLAGVLRRVIAAPDIQNSLANS